MKAVFFIEPDNYVQAKGKVYGDELVSRQSITLRDSSSLGVDKKGYYLLVDGEDESIKQAKKILSGLAKELTGPEAEKVLSAIEQQESSAAEGFGAIFG